MAEKHLTESYAQGENCTVKKQGGAKLFQAITVIFIPLLWIGYFYSLYRGNESNVSHYTLLILMFSLINSDILLKGEKMQSKALNILAKIEGILLVVWGVATIVSLILK